MSRENLTDLHKQLPSYVAMKRGTSLGEDKVHRNDDLDRRIDIPCDYGRPLAISAIISGW